MKKKKNIVLILISFLFVFLISVLVYKILYNRQHNDLIDLIQDEYVILHQEETEKYIISLQDEEKSLSLNEKLEMAKILSKQGAYIDSLKLYNEIIQEDRTNINIIYDIAKIYFDMGNFDKSLEFLDYILNNLDDNHYNSIILKAHIHINKLNLSVAENILLNQNLNRQEVRYLLSLIRLYDLEISQALLNLNEAINANPSSIIAGYVNNIRQNITVFDLYSDGKQEFLELLIVESLVQNREYDLSIHILNRILRQNPNYRDAYILLAYSYIQKKDFEKALDSLDEAYRIDAKNSQIQYLLGVTFANLDKNDQALRHFLMAELYDFQPEYEVYKNIADLYFIEKQYKQSADYYNKVINIRPTYGLDIYVRLVWLYIDFIEDNEAAINIALTCNKYFPDNAMTYNLIGWSYLDENLEKAKENLEKAKEMDPSLQAVYLNLGKYYKKRKNIQLAKDYFRECYYMNKFSSIGQLAAIEYNNIIANE